MEINTYYEIYRYNGNQVQLIITNEIEITELYKTNKLIIKDSLDKTEFNLGVYNELVTKNYEEAKKYYLLAIEKGNIAGMNGLGLYFENIEKNYDEAKKYYMMAIEKGDPEAMYNLAGYYESIEKNYEELKNTI